MALQSELGIQARRASVKLTEPQYQQAADLVRAGQSPAEAVRAVGTPMPPPKLKVTAAERGTYAELRRRGKSDEEILALIRIQRELAARLGTPTTEAVQRAVAERNASGEWPE
jgi:hypothetical protein